MVGIDLSNTVHYATTLPHSPSNIDVFCMIYKSWGPKDYIKFSEYCCAVCIRLNG